ncbi:MAG TPA: hypothetical protein VKE70_23045, partial [Candidatus Solibacter sp.]|nr:hypothetical protein [Candidatus Solibacter sp.]
FASGGVRFRMNSWFDVQQVGGAFETGLTNRVPVELAYRVRSGSSDPSETRMYLEAMGTEYVAVHGEKSKEYYRDFRRPDRLSAFPVVYQGEDDAVYALPQRPLAHLMTEKEIPPADVLDHPELLRPYVSAIEDASRPLLKVEWKDVSHLVISGTVKGGGLISLQVNAADGWRASQDSINVPLTRDGLGFLVLHPQEGGAIHLGFRPTWEQLIFASISALAWVLAIAYAVRSRVK